MADTKETQKAEVKAEETRKAPETGKAPLTKFKYVGGDDRGVNEFKSRTYYDIQFPLGVEVEVPDSLVHKLRLKDDMKEVSGSVPKTFAEQQREKDTKQDKGKSESVDISPEELAELRRKAAREDARVEQVRADAQKGR